MSRIFKHSFAIVLIAFTIGLSQNALAVDDVNCDISPPLGMDVALLVQGRSKVKEAFGEKLKDAVTNSDRELLINDILKSAAETPYGTSDYYALIEFAWKQCFKLDSINRSIDLAAKLDSDFPSLNQKAQIATVDCLLQKRLPATDRIAVFKLGFNLARASIRRVDFKQFGEIIELLSSNADGFRDRKSLLECEELKKIAKQVEDKYEDYKTANLKLELGMVDPEVNESVGLFRCLWLGDWLTGLPLLKKAKTESIVVVADQELAGGMASELAAKWWTLSEDLPLIYRERAIERSVYHYKQALPLLKGIDKAVCEQRLAKASALGVDSPDKPVPIQKFSTGDWLDVFPLENPDTARYWKDNFDPKSKSLSLTSTRDTQSICALNIDALDVVVSFTVSFRRPGRTYVEVRSSQQGGLSFVIDSGGVTSFGYYQTAGWKHLKDIRIRSTEGPLEVKVAVAKEKMTAWLNGALVGTITNIPITRSGSIRFGTSDGAIAEISSVKFLIPSGQQVSSWNFD
jgi:hypothetical protein